MARMVNVGILGSVGFALLSAGCSDPSAPPPRAGLEFASRRGGEAGLSCSSRSHQALLPAGEFPSRANPGVPIEDGESGAEVQCAVQSSGSGFQVSGTVNLGQISFNVSGTLDSEGVGDQMQVVFWNFDWGNGQLSGFPCTVDASQAPFYVEPGAVYAAVSCPRMDTQSVSCAGAGVMVFDRCEGG